MRKIIFLFFILILIAVNTTDGATVLIQKGKEWGKIKRIWGYEVRVDFEDVDTGKIYNEVLTFKTDPKDGLGKAILDFKSDLEIRVEKEKEVVIKDENTQMGNEEKLRKILATEFLQKDANEKLVDIYKIAKGVL